MDYIKIILLGITLVLLSVRIINLNLNNRPYKSFFISSFFITLILFLIIIMKLHHLLRSEFNVPNTVIYLLIATLLIFYLYKFISVLKSNNFYLFISSVIVFALASTLDLLTDAKIIYFSAADFMEEILRIFGALLWMIYFLFFKPIITNN